MIGPAGNRWIAIEGADFHVLSKHTGLKQADLTNNCLILPEALKAIITRLYGHMLACEKNLTSVF